MAHGRVSPDAVMHEVFEAFLEVVTRTTWHLDLGVKSMLSHQDSHIRKSVKVLL